MQNSITPVPPTRAGRFHSLLWLRLGSLVLLYAGLNNGFPLITYDTGTYLGSGMTLTVPHNRPLTYGLFTRLASLNFSLWFVTFLRCLLLAAQHGPAVLAAGLRRLGLRPAGGEGPRTGPQPGLPGAEAE